MTKYDVLIIGGGVVGTSLARELSRYRLRVALLEKEIELAFGVSKSNSGIIHPGTQNRPGTLKARLCVEGNALTQRLASELGIDFNRTGELIVAFGQQEAQALRILQKDALSLGVRGLRIVDKKWLAANEPNLAKEAACALLASSAGVISPYRWVYDFAENAASNGVEIFTDTEVISISRAGGCFSVGAAKRTFSARFVVNAAGLYADRVSQMAGAGGFTIRPRKGEEFLLDKKTRNMTRHLLFPMPSKDTKGVLVTRTSDGNPMIGPTSQDVDDKEDLSTSQEGLEKVLAGAKKLVPSINRSDIIAYFAGLRPVCGDDFIIRHEDSVPGFINVAGIQSPGLTAAPAIAMMVTDILKEKGLGLRKKLFFKKYRKKEHHLFSIPLAGTKRLVGKDPAFGDIVCRCEMVSAKEVREAIARGAKTMDGIKFRTRAQSGRCHGSFCTTRIMKILGEETGVPATGVTKRGGCSCIVKKDRSDVK